jgi:hypothetical protein
MAQRSEAKSAKRSFALKYLKNKNLEYFIEKLRFALLASLRSAIFGEIRVDN